MPNQLCFTPERFKAEMLRLLCAIIERELTQSTVGPTHTAPSRCPRCGSASITKRGRDATGKQRYQCNSCKRSFTASTGSAFSSTNICAETWIAFAKCYVEQRTLRDAAVRCGVSLKTAFHMRKRLDTTLAWYRNHLEKALAGMRR